ncbi:MAG: tetratricopeptide repeat protein [Spirochaetales bacterium]|nr:tetratricopeptide repeat protein [Spirochaetales bacterium]
MKFNNNDTTNKPAVTTACFEIKIKSFMKKCLNIIVFVIVCTVMMHGCSSAPEKKEGEVEKKNRAAEYARYGNDYYNQGIYDRSLDFFNLSLAYNGAVFNEKGMISSYNSIGKVYSAIGDMESAEENFSNALEIARRLGTADLIAQTLNNLGELYFRTRQFNESLAHFEEALTYKNKIPRSEIAVIYHNMGTVYKRLDDFDTAFSYFKKALTINTEKKLYEEAASNQYMIASLHLEKGDIKKALDSAEKALSLDKKVENSLGIAKDYYALGIINLRAENEEEAYRFFKQSLFIYQSLKVIYPNFTIERELQTLLEYLIPLSEKIDGSEKADEYRELQKESVLQKESAQ